MPYKCPKCKTMNKNCCEKYLEKHQTFNEMAKEPHSCGPSCCTCKKCGYLYYPCFQESREGRLCL